VKVSVNTSGVTDVDTLATAINAASRAPAMALAGCHGVQECGHHGVGEHGLYRQEAADIQFVHDGISGGRRDKVSSALLGQFEQNASLTGTNAAASLATNGGGTANQLTVAIDGGSAFTVSVTNAATVSRARSLTT